METTMDCCESRSSAVTSRRSLLLGGASFAAWAAPEGMKLRLDISAQIASRLADGVDPRDLLELVAADAASSETRRTIERAESRQQALALLLMSPEFQRR